ncbi:MAG: signal recognition particle-docking protein FtsY [Bacteroidetes bacterium RIFCSPLOWO2_12_FULL_37_12]|nr:MAG: signal recognition particle-docking protein FtsY [Bacteroidetes bacterium RIFCSPLOWO2_12_FULL_37_12]
MSLFNIFKKTSTPESGVEKTRQNLFSLLKKVVLGKSQIDDEVLDRLEEQLILADVGVETTLRIIKKIENRVKTEKYISTGELNKYLKEEVVALLQENTVQANETNIQKPLVIMVVGVNGVGKTTTIGKLAHYFKHSGKSVILGAADTFRAAAVDQLTIWAKRIDVPLVAQGMNADPSSVAFETVKKGKEENADVIIIDTAGRLHTKINLMNELNKIKRVMQKIIPDAPHEVLLVLDASTGQNAFQQTIEFTKATNVNALAVTKLDGTAKGGVILGISDQFKIPVKYIGVGEKAEDLRIFNRNEFVESLFKEF